MRVACGNGDVHPKRFPISASAAAQNPQRAVKAGQFTFTPLPVGGGIPVLLSDEGEVA